MRPFIVGLAASLAGAALAQLAPPDTRAALPTNRVVTAATPLDSHPEGAADPYALLSHCREEVRAFLSVSTESVSSRQQALENCLAAAERDAGVEVAGP